MLLIDVDVSAVSFRQARWRLGVAFQHEISNDTRQGQCSRIRPGVAGWRSRAGHQIPATQKRKFSQNRKERPGNVPKGLPKKGELTTEPNSR